MFYNMLLFKVDGRGFNIYDIMRMSENSHLEPFLFNSSPDLCVAIIVRLNVPKDKFLQDIEIESREVLAFEISKDTPLGMINMNSEDKERLAEFFEKKCSCQMAEESGVSIGSLIKNVISGLGVSFYDENSIKSVTQEDIDKIFDKVRREGEESLSKEEKEKIQFFYQNHK